MEVTYNDLQLILSRKHIPFNAVKLVGENAEIYDRIEVYDSKLMLPVTKMQLSELFKSLPVKITTNEKREAIIIEINK